MSKVKISAAQFKVKKIDNVKEFYSHVKSFVEAAAKQKSDFVVFPEYHTSEIITSFPEASKASMNEVPSLFKKLAKEYCKEYVETIKQFSSEYGLTIIGWNLSYNSEDNRIYNVAYLAEPDGFMFEQRKIHIYPAEKLWDVEGYNKLEVVKTKKAKVGLMICYDSEFPEIARTLMFKGAQILFCPSAAFSERGFWRVRHSCEARAVENQVYVVQCSCLGELPFPVESPFSFWGRASILTPIDDVINVPNGVLVEGKTNEESLITGEVDLEKLNLSRNSSEATILKDRRLDIFTVLYHPP